MNPSNPFGRQDERNNAMTKQAQALARKIETATPGQAVSVSAKEYDEFTTAQREFVKRMKEITTHIPSGFNTFDGQPFSHTPSPPYLTVANALQQASEPELESELQRRKFFDVSEQERALGEFFDTLYLRIDCKSAYLEPWADQQDEPDECTRDTINGERLSCLAESFRYLHYLPKQMVVMHSWMMQAAIPREWIEDGWERDQCISDAIEALLLHAREITERLDCHVQNPRHQRMYWRRRPKITLVDAQDTGELLVTLHFRAGIEGSEWSGNWQPGYKAIRIGLTPEKLVSGERVLIER